MTTKQSAELKIGAVVGGKYRLDALLGSGGMGFVYRGFHVLLERDVALKVVRPEFAMNSESAERFLAEARAANAVRHPHVVDVLDVAIEDGMPMIVQEFLEGETLASRLEAHARLMVDETLELLTPIAAALAHAHERSIVHRDIKPENIFLSEANGGTVPKLLDFGIAQSLREELSSDSIIAGTPAYMAPELVLDPEVRDTRSDLWSLGVVLFECLTGQLPFDGATPSAMFTAICHEEPKRVQSLRPEIPPEVAAVVDRCLARDPSRRFDSARALLAALEAARVRVVGDRPTSRVRWHSTLAPGTLRSSAAILARAQRDHALAVTSDDNEGVIAEPAAPAPIAAPAPAGRSPSVRPVPAAASEPPTGAVSVATSARRKAPARATMGLAVVFATLAIVPLWWSQRRGPEAREVASPVSAAPLLEPRATPTIEVRAEPPRRPLPSIVRTQPVAPSTEREPDRAQADRVSARPAHARVRAVGARAAQVRRAAPDRDAALVTTPVIQLRDER